MSRLVEINIVTNLKEKESKIRTLGAVKSLSILVMKMKQEFHLEYYFQKL